MKSAPAKSTSRHRLFSGPEVKYDPPLELGPAPADAVGRKGAKAVKPNSLKAQLSRKTQLPPAESKPNTDDVLYLGVVSMQVHVWST